MDLLILSGAYKNAGDFLIEKRTIEILKSLIPDCTIKKYLRKEMLDILHQINTADALVFSGGPLYMESLKGYIPVLKEIDRINTRSIIIGGGWYGRGGGDALTYKYRFDSRTYSFLKIIDETGFGLGCRDLYSKKILDNAGFKNVYTTGCPAWYDLQNLHNIKPFSKNDAIRRITISDPAFRKNERLAIDLVQYVKNKFAEADITFVYHRGIDKNTQLYKWLCDKGIKTIDISGGIEGFAKYQHADLHIGFRVHAHLYNLSIRHRSILIEEDGRGTGANEILGLPSIKAYNDELQISSRNINRLRTIIGKSVNMNCIKELDTYIETSQNVNWIYITNAFRIQERFFESMRRHILKLTE